MTVSKSEYMECRYEVVGGLIDVATAALLADFPTLSADHYDIELVLDAVRVLRPKVPELGVLEGIRQIALGHWDDAIYALREVSEAAPNFSYAKALLAFCLSVKGDEEWRLLATEAEELNPTESGRRVVNVLQARADLVKAIQVSNTGGEFVYPESLKALGTPVSKAERDERWLASCRD